MIGSLTVEPIISCFGFAFLFYTSITPQLVLQKICYNKYNESICTNLPLFKAEQLYIQKEASLWVMAIFLCETITAFFCVLFWGSLTDIIGRKKGFIYITIAMGIQHMILSFCAHFLRSSPAYILLASITGGSYGSIQGVISICCSYIAYITRNDVNVRTKRMGIAEASLGISSAVGGLTSGLFLKYTSFTTVYLSLCGIAIILFIYVLLLYKTEKHRLSYEKIDGENILANGDEVTFTNNYQFKLSHLSPLFLLKQIYHTITMNRNCTSLVLLMFIYLFGVMMFETDYYVMPLYLKNSPFNFDSEFIGYYMAFGTVIYSIGLVVSVYVCAYFNFSEYSLVLVGFVSQVAIHVLNGFSRTKLMVFLVRFAGFFASVIATTIRSKMSKFVSPSQYGCILGGIVAVDVLGGITVNFVGLSIYRITLSFYSGTVFFIFGFFSFVGLLLTICAYKRDTNEESNKIQN